MTDHVQNILTALDAMVAEQSRLKHAFATTMNTVEQTLGKVLGFPEYTADMFEDGIATGEVCVGDHVPESLAVEAAERILKLETELARLRDHFCPAQLHCWPKSARDSGECYSCGKLELAKTCKHQAYTTVWNLDGPQRCCVFCDAVF